MHFQSIAPQPFSHQHIKSPLHLDVHCLTCAVEPLERRNILLLQICSTNCAALLTNTDSLAASLEQRHIIAECNQHCWHSHMASRDQWRFPSADVNRKMALPKWKPPKLTKIQKSYRQLKHIKLQQQNGSPFSKLFVESTPQVCNRWYSCSSIQPLHIWKGNTEQSSQ